MISPERFTDFINMVSQSCCFMGIEKYGMKNIKIRTFFEQYRNEGSLPVLLGVLEEAFCEIFQILIRILSVDHFLMKKTFSLKMYENVQKSILKQKEAIF
jgi:hypothetical protein